MDMKEIGRRFKLIRSLANEDNMILISFVGISLLRR